MNQIFEILDLTAQVIVCQMGQALFNSEFANWLPHQVTRKIVRMVRIIARRMARMMVRMMVRMIARTMSRRTLMTQIMDEEPCAGELRDRKAQQWN
jgi:hypothetical protein